MVRTRKNWFNNKKENCEAESRDISNGDIYSDSDDEDKRKDKEELIEEKEKCEEQSKDNLTPEGGDACDSGDHESNGNWTRKLVEQQQQEENCEAESKDNSTGIIHELHVGESIRIEIHEEMEELVCNMTAQEQNESIIKEEKAKEEFGGQYKELSTRQAFLFMGPIYENPMQDVVNEAVTKTLDKDETVQKLKRSHRIKDNTIIYSRV